MTISRSVRTADDVPVSFAVMYFIPTNGRERLVIVRHGAQEYVLGVTAASISLIDKRTASSHDLPANDAKIGET